LIKITAIAAQVMKKETMPKQKNAPVFNVQKEKVA